MAPAHLTEVTTMSHLLSRLVMATSVVLMHFTASVHTAIVCEGWCYPEGVCTSTGTQCGCNNSASMYSTCAHRLQPDPEANCNGKCHNDGTCILHNGFPMCVCPSAYYGYSCEFVRTETCSKQCLNGGICQTTKISDVTAETCVCPSHHYGELCHLRSTGDCTGKCHNDGTCIFKNGFPICVCPSGYYGYSCEFQNTETCSKQCLNGGTCQTIKTTEVTAETCICLSQHYGDLCHLSSTACTEPCLHGGVCQWGNCLCSQQFTGSGCQLKREACTSQYCLNGGTCIYDFSQTTHCLCPIGFHGNRCEEQEVAYFDESVRHPQRLSPGNIAAIVVIVFVTLGLSVGVRYFRKWKIGRLRRNRQHNNTALNNRPWVERSCSTHSGVNFVRIPDISPLHSPNPIPPSYSCSTSSSGGFAVSLNQDSDEAAARGELPPPYDAVAENNIVPSKSNSMRFQELNCRSLNET